MKYFSSVRCVNVCMQGSLCPWRQNPLAQEPYQQWNHDKEVRHTQDPNTSAPHTAPAAVSAMILRVRSSNRNARAKKYKLQIMKHTPAVMAVQ